MKYDENKNAIGNIGSIWEKVSSNHESGGYYYLLKLNVKEPGNQTFVAFKNEHHDGELASKIPLYFVFRYKPRAKKENE